jgi:hypothetical protein
MEREKTNTVDCNHCHQCSHCHRVILPDERIVRFKIPGKEVYQFFHYRQRVGDCWEGRLSEHP